MNIQSTKIARVLAHINGYSNRQKIRSEYSVIENWEYSNMINDLKYYSNTKGNDKMNIQISREG